MSNTGKTRIDATVLVRVTHVDASGTETVQEHTHQLEKCSFTTSAFASSKTFELRGDVIRREAEPACSTN